MAKNRRDGLKYQEKFVELLKQRKKVDRYILAQELFDFDSYEAANSEKYRGKPWDKRRIDPDKYKAAVFADFEETERRNFTNAINQVKRKILLNFGIELSEEPSKKRSNVSCYWWPEDANVSLLADFFQTTKKERLLRTQNAIELMKSSYGILPTSWLAKLVENDLNNDDENKIIEFDQSELYGVEKLPEFYFAIRDKYAVRFKYHPWGKKAETILLHPHYLKEYNFRWYVFGIGVDGKSQKEFHWALDRISGKIQKEDGVVYLESNRDYTTYFDDIIGVTHIKNAKIEKITIITKGNAIHNRLLTKPIHGSQDEIEPFDKAKGSGKFSLEIKYNPELISRILSFGASITVEGAKNSRIVKKLREEYKKISEMSD